MDLVQFINRGQAMNVKFLHRLQLSCKEAITFELKHDIYSVTFFLKLDFQSYFQQTDLVYCVYPHFLTMLPKMFEETNSNPMMRQ